LPMRSALRWRKLVSWIITEEWIYENFYGDKFKQIILFNHPQYMIRLCGSMKNIQIVSRGAPSSAILPKVFQNGPAYSRIDRFSHQSR
jgi:hypothetical protein